jgi:predicted ATP-binding protein involved in virulence
MKINKFSGRKIYGYLRFDVDFYSDLTFLHGINGCGKTTALKAVVSLLGPDLLWLATNSYETLEVDLTLENERIKVRAENDREHVRISYIAGRKTFKSELPLRDVSQISFDDSDLRLAAIDKVDWIKEKLKSSIRDISAIQQIENLPTPTFLGLERTTLPNLDDRYFRNRVERRTARPYFRTSLDESLREADRLLQESIRQVLAEKSKLSEELRSNITFSLFDINPKRRGPNPILGAWPTSVEIEKLRDIRERLLHTFQVARLDPSMAKAKVNAYFDELLSRAEPIAAFANPKAVMDAAGKSQKEQDAAANSIIAWFNVSPRLEIIENVMRTIEDFSAKDLKVMEHLQQYFTFVNSFFNDSGKNLMMGERGEVQISLPSNHRGDVSLLSSGERQIFVLLTHLALNPKSRAANVLIIDEPELSLHLKWQETFVEAVHRINPQTQMILATHSPTIIMNREKNCVLLNQ